MTDDRDKFVVRVSGRVEVGISFLMGVMIALTTMLQIYFE